MCTHDIKYKVQSNATKLMISKPLISKHGNVISS